MWSIKYIKSYRLITNHYVTVFQKLQRIPFLLPYPWIPFGVSAHGPPLSHVPTQWFKCVYKYESLLELWGTFQKFLKKNLSYKHDPCFKIKWQLKKFGRKQGISKIRTLLGIVAFWLGMDTPIVIMIVIPVLVQCNWRIRVMIFLSLSEPDFMVPTVICIFVVQFQSKNLGQVLWA